MALRQGKGGIFTPASAGCAYSIEERIWRALTIALVCSAVCTQPNHLAGGMPQIRASLPE
jgi:hypothetical protein